MAPNCPKITKNRKIIVICVIFLLTVMIPFPKHFISEFKWIKNFITHIISAKFLEFLWILKIIGVDSPVFPPVPSDHPCALH